MSIAKKKNSISDFSDKEGHILVATKYKNTVTNYFAKKGIRAECIKLNGAIELAPKLGICSTIVDLVSTGKTIKENNLKETDILLRITSKLRILVMRLDIVLSLYILRYCSLSLTLSS